jgi:predicted Zn-dependent protease
LQEEKALALKMAPVKDREAIAWFCNERTKIILDQVSAGFFIADDSLQNYVSNILKRLEEPIGSTRPRIVLISRSSQVNASCFGRGIYIVTVGLLARIRHEGELAFTLAHEIAHDELNHVQDNLLRYARVRLKHKSKQQVKAIFGGTADFEDILEWRRMIYEAGRHSRRKELAADSLGFIIFNDARYDERHATAMLSTLDASYAPKYDLGADIFMPLDAEQFPLQPYFFKERLSIFSKKDLGNIFMLSLDSAKTHPDMDIRMEMLTNYLAGSSYEDKGQSSEFVTAVTRRAEFETVEAAYKNDSYDWCLFHALHLLQRYPNNRYLIERVASVLVKLHEVKSNGQFIDGYVSLFTTYYSPAAKLINNLLHNITTNEMGDMAYFFLRNPDHFDVQSESHYYLLWKISVQTLRYERRDAVAAEYKKAFGKNISAMEYFVVDAPKFDWKAFMR